MKKLLCILLSLLCLLLFAVGCGKTDDEAGEEDPDVSAETLDPATEGDLPVIVTDAASSGTIPDVPASEGDLPSIDASKLTGRLWRDDRGSVTRELRLLTDGSFQYRAGDPDSEYYRWVIGTWVLTGSSLSFQARMADETWTKLDGASPFLVDYTPTLSGDTLALSYVEGTSLDEGEGWQNLLFTQIPD